ncbi:hypothetical protein WAI453_009317 [Rhynchosporium graminicola]
MFASQPQTPQPLLSFEPLTASQLVPTSTLTTSNFIALSEIIQYYFSSANQQDLKETKPIMSAFDTAVVDSKKLTSKPSNDDLLQLYGLFKVASGEDISKAEQPGTFDLKGKAKKKAWQKIVDEGLTSDQAKEKYVALVESLKEKYGYDANKSPEAVGS